MQQILLLITILLFVCYSLLIIYYKSGWHQLPFYKPAANNNPLVKISVIIPARNEEINIAPCLDSLLQQTYPPHLFEVLVVDDFSTDATASIVKNFTTQNVKLLQLANFTNDAALNSYKKKAIEIAVQQATGQLIVTTDADCIAPKNWLLTIAKFYEEQQPAFIAMPVSILPSPAEKGLRVRPFIEIFQTLDFMTLQGITGAAVYKKKLSMCNGANLAYTKAAFNAVQGFKGIDNIASGDDMLLMHKIFKHQPDKIFFLKSKEVIVQTQPVKTVKEFFNQRIRWASKADKYDDKRIFAVLLVVYLFNCLMLLLPIFSLFSNATLSLFNFHYSLIQVWLVQLFLKTVVELLFLLPVAYFFNKQKLMRWFPLMQPFHIFYTVIAGWLGKFGSYKWKGRSVQ